MEVSLCFLSELMSSGPVEGPLSDLLGLRLPLSLQSRPAQISDGTLYRTESKDFAKHSDISVSAHEAEREMRLYQREVVRFGP
jgi:hypothetical protein